MGIAALHPSYKSGTLDGNTSSLSTSVKTRVNQQTQNARLMSSSMLFRTQSRHRVMFVSRSTCSAVPARHLDETLVQQPSSDLAEGASLGSDRLRVEI
jgi:hypothetical protein